MTMILPVTLMIGACSSKNKIVNDAASGQQSVASVGLTGARSLPKATAFKMNGNYSKQVGVTLDNNGRLTYFPAPGDITPNSVPLDLGNGWWLNRQGIGEGSVFTRWTFEEYSKLKNVPTQEEILKSIIPGSKVESFTVLPYSQNGILTHLEEVKEFLNGPVPPAP